MALDEPQTHRHMPLWCSPPAGPTCVVQLAGAISGESDAPAGPSLHVACTHDVPLPVTMSPGLQAALLVSNLTGGVRKDEHCTAWLRCAAVCSGHLSHKPPHELAPGSDQRSNAMPVNPQARVVRCPPPALRSGAARCNAQSLSTMHGLACWSLLDAWTAPKARAIW